MTKKAGSIASGLARPRTNTVRDEEERVDTFKKAMDEAKPKATAKPKSTEPKAKLTINVPKQARDELKIYAIRKGTSLEQLLIEALQTQLDGEGAGISLG